MVLVHIVERFLVHEVYVILITLKSLITWLTIDCGSQRVNSGELASWIDGWVTFRWQCLSYDLFLLVVRSKGTWFNLLSAQFEPLSVNDTILEYRR